MRLLPFVEVEEGPLEQKRIFNVRQDRVRSGLTGREMQVDRLMVPDWVNVVAFDDDDHLILVRQWRFGARDFSVEIPAGALEAGEDPSAGGLRELAEETGFTPVDGRVVLLGATRPNAAFMNNRCFSLFVPLARKTREQKLDPSEEVEILRVPRTDIDGFLTRGARRCAGQPETGGDNHPVLDSLMDNSLVLVALHFWKLHVQGG